MSRPTDVELMMYFDGELEPERQAAVATYLGESTEASNKVRGLGVAAEMIALRASRSPAADGVADAVMAAIAEGSKKIAPAKDQPRDIELMMYFDGELEDERRDAIEAHLASSRAAGAKVRALGLGSEMLARHVSRSSAAADGIADAVMAVIAEDAAKQDELGVAPRTNAVTPSKRAPVAANDNARRIYAAALLAVAAAAGLLIWGRGADTMPTASPTPSADVATSVEVAAATAPPASASPSAPGSATEEEAEPEAVHGVEVAAVEFGGKMGSIFYVPSGETGSGNTTTVVWLADEAGEE